MRGATRLVETVRAARAGDGAAFDRLAALYRPGVFALCLDRTRDFDVAEDLTQQTLLKAHAALSELRQAEAFPRWLRQIALNCCRSWLRRPAPDLVSLEAQALVVPTEDTYAAAARRQLAREVSAAMARVPEANRIALLMHLQGSTAREIAAFVGVPETTIVGRLHRARSRLRVLLRERLGEAVAGRAADWKETAT